MADRAARSTANVLVTGEPGTGRRRLARRLHDRSDRRSGPFTRVPCANLSTDLLESDLFGHEEGAFTDARRRRAGRFEEAGGGTLFLDGIQELAPEAQAKLLRALEERRFERLGGFETIEIDARVVASTLAYPENTLVPGRLREDLYYRLNVVRLDLPPLRARMSDLRILAEVFLQEAVARHRLPARTLAGCALARLERHDWPGNLPELRHTLERAALLCSGESITVADLSSDLSVSSPSMLRAAAGDGLSLAQLEDAYIEEVLRRTRGNKSAAARILGIHRKTLHEKLRRDS
jgi:two-component system response regulator HydG